MSVMEGYVRERAKVHPEAAKITGKLRKSVRKLQRSFEGARAKERKLRKLRERASEGAEIAETARTSGR